ncbi:MAG TPA: heterodisulfide reductase-related iron-sulfur binding cluster [Longimicrobiales bacterium]|nr:heterodisulfide reductase-related iron-sulfur binding cluster [Longimicrobiales bacterium]
MSRNDEAPLAAEMDRLLACVHCGFCLQACPTYIRLGDEADSPRGRLLLMRAVAEGRLDADAPAFAEHIDRCLGCRACETVCPSGVQYGHLLERAREAAVGARGQPLLTRVMLAVFANRALSRPLLALARAVRASGLAGLAARVLPRSWRGPRLAAAMLAATQPARATISSTTGVVGKAAGNGVRNRHGPGARPLRVGVLRGCVQEGLFRHVNDATWRVLAAAGCEVVPVPDQGCCGALHAHAGDLDTARRLARSNIEAFRAAGVDVIAVNAAGCGSAMKEYGELLADDPGVDAAGFSRRVRDVSELLHELGVAPPGPVQLRVTYDAPCHLQHAQRITAAPVELLRAIPGVELVPLAGADQCCGGAGIYGITHPDLAGRILDDKVRAIQDTGADVVVTPNPGCIMQIGAGLILSGSRVRVRHPIELLDESFRSGS